MLTLFDKWMAVKFLMQYYSYFELLKHTDGKNARWSAEGDGEESGNVEERRGKSWERKHSAAAVTSCRVSSGAEKCASWKQPAQSLFWIY